MAQTVFYPGLNEFCRKYLVEVPGATPSNPTEFASEGIKQQTSLFENLLLFDKISFKITGESIPLALLTGLLGSKTFDALVEQGALEVITHPLALERFG